MNFKEILTRPTSLSFPIRWEDEEIECPTYPITKGELEELSDVDDKSVIGDTFFQRINDRRFIVYNDEFGFISIRQDLE